MKIQEVIVVEGKNDTAVLKSYFDCDTIETHGTCLSDFTLQLIEKMKEKRGVIIFTDPDYPGESIRKQINQRVKGCKNAFIDRKKAKTTKKVGVEHASKEDLYECYNTFYNPSNMTELDLATNGFGQNFNLTMVQMTTAFSSLINGGYLYRPYTVKGIYNASGELLKSFDRVLVAQTISPSTSDFVKECLRSVVTDGTGKPAAVEGYKIAGKTGTAQKYDKEGDLYVISFIGFAPYDNPEVVCYVAIDEPETGDASRYASELFSRIMTNVLSYMNIAPDDLG